MNVLLLQGPNTRFMLRLARALAQTGRQVTKVNFCGADAFHWWPHGAIRYDRTEAELPDFYDWLIRERRIGSVILFGDRRPVHRPVFAVAERLGVPVHVLEDGYLRPHWITLDRGGANALSAMPRDPAEIAALARDLPSVANPPRLPAGWLQRIHDELWAQIFSVLLRRRYPHYRTHRPMAPLVEDFRLAGSYLRRRLRKRGDRVRLRRLAPDRYFFMPLQLDADYQIRDHSPFAHQGEALGQVVSSFARHAPAGTVLAIKSHPLDPSVVDYRRVAESLALAANIRERVVFLDGGDTAALVRGCRAVVTVNSTVGMSALVHGKPVKTLGHAIYDVPGLTHAGPLDGFWADPRAPDRQLFRDFRALMIHRTQVHGNFYSPPGQRAAIANILGRLTQTPVVPLPTVAREQAVETLA